MDPGESSPIYHSERVPYHCSRLSRQVGIRLVCYEQRPLPISIAQFQFTDMGGEGAVLDPADSVASMIGVLKGLKKEDAGSYLTYQGEPIPW